MSHTITTRKHVIEIGGPLGDHLTRRQRTARAQGNYAPGARGAAAASRLATEARANAFLDREALLDDAIHQGVIGGALRDHYATCYDRDPGGTQAYLQSLGLRTTVAAASAEGYVETNLSTAERKRIAAARDGRQTARIVNGGL
jgi:hypothetical protein